MSQPRMCDRCVICKRLRSPRGNRVIGQFKRMLKRLGVEGEKAHRDCVAGVMLEGAAKALANHRQGGV